MRLNMARRFARFKEMKELGYFNNRMDARRKVWNGWPAAKELSPNTIAWDLDEIEEHVANLPRRIPGQTKPGHAKNFPRVLAKTERAADDLAREAAET
jgi:hypothetical protein